MRYLFLLIILLNPSWCFAGVNLDWYDATASGLTCSGDYGDISTYASNGTDGQTAGVIVLARVAVGCSGTISSITETIYYADISTRQIEYTIYADDGTGTDPAALLGSYGQIYDAGSASIGVAITDSTVSQSITGSPTYIWVGYQKQVDSTSLYRGNTGAGTTETRIYQGTWGTFPATWPTGSDIAENNRDRAIYVTF